MFDHSSNFSSEGLYNRIIMASHSDKWSIVVEDSGKEYEYEQIFARLFHGTHLTFNFFSVGGKTAVIAAFNELSSEEINTGSLGEIYLVDGDFDFICPTNFNIQHDSFILLDRYNIESYFIDKSAIESFAKGKMRVTNEHVVSSVNYLEWHRETVSDLFNLFVLFYMVKKNSIDIQNVGSSPDKFINRSSGGRFNNDSYNTYRDLVKSFFSNDSHFEAELQSCTNVVLNSINNHKDRLICGKYCLYSLAGHLNSNLKIQFKHDELRWWLIDHIDINTLEWLKNRILQITT